MMAPKTITSGLKFVGTVSLGLLTGTSYTLTTFTVPSLLELPSASTAAKTFRSLSTKASTHINALSGVAGTAFFLAFALSPRRFRHPYLLYTSLVCFSGTHLAAYITPLIFGTPSSGASSSAKKKRAALAQARKEQRSSSSRGMEASYEVLGGSDSHSDEGAEQEELELDEEINGEEVRGEVEFFLKNQLVNTVISGVAFSMAVIGIWGDGAVRAQRVSFR